VTLTLSVELSVGEDGKMDAAEMTGAVLEMVTVLDATALPDDVPSLGVAVQYTSSPRPK
jgi:hypothetical protein